jgi:hypothetical protein
MMSSVASGVNRFCGGRFCGGAWMGGARAEDGDLRFDPELSLIALP